ncbi:MAG: hypothetical protein GF408_05785 [Candidatus Omnitrophica bacterium]|nr:hypothetical protein [Candidatus Omnitrophota bacterium]
MSQKTIPHSRPTLGQEELRAAAKVIESGHIAQGPKVSEFEEALAAFLGVKGAVVTNSGSSAMHLALMSLGLSAGDEVVMPSFVCTAPLNAAYQAGLGPRVCDIEEESLNVSAGTVSEVLEDAVKAAVVPHMFGNVADVEDIEDLGLTVIEDCAHALGALYGEKKAGSCGKMGILSFYANKMMACGEGGAVVSDDENLLRFVSDRRDYDERGDYRPRYNYKMTDIQAAIGLEQLKKLPGFVERRKEIASRYSEAFAETGAVLPGVEFDHVYYRYVILVKKDLAQVLKELEVKGVKCARPVHSPLHRALELRSGFRVTDKVYSGALSVPIYPSLTDEEQEKVIEAVISSL